jgi:hypothetical protein
MFNGPGLLGSRESPELRRRPACLWMGILIAAHCMHDFSPGQIFCHHGNVSPTRGLDRYVSPTRGLDRYVSPTRGLDRWNCLGAPTHRWQETALSRGRDIDGLERSRSCWWISSNRWSVLPSNYLGGCISAHTVLHRHPKISFSGNNTPLNPTRLD